MKRTIISTISVVVLSTVLSGCMDKLEILPNDQIITENFFEEGSPEEIESGVNSMYQRLQSSYMYNLRMWTLDIVAGEGRVGNEAGGNGLDGKNIIQKFRVFKKKEIFAIQKIQSDRPVPHLFEVQNKGYCPQQNNILSVPSHNRSHDLPPHSLPLQTPVP